jgi:hypothetical protein
LKKGDSFTYKGISYVCQTIIGDTVHASKVVNGKTQRGRPAKILLSALSISSAAPKNKVPELKSKPPKKLSPAQQLKKQKSILSVIKVAHKLNPASKMTRENWVRDNTSCL